MVDCLDADGGSVGVDELGGDGEGLFGELVGGLGAELDLADFGSVDLDGAGFAPFAAEDGDGEFEGGIWLGTNTVFKPLRRFAVAFAEVCGGAGFFAAVVVLDF